MLRGETVTLSEVSIRPESAGDEARSTRSTGWRSGVRPSRGWSTPFVRPTAFIPELSLVAEQAGRIAAHILFSRATIRTTAGEIPVLVLGPIAVLPECQNRGLGSQLIEAGLEDARETG